jgi:hypothetical protein
MRILSLLLLIIFSLSNNIKSQSSPVYIHHNLNNGNWTTAPGDVLNDKGVIRTLRIQALGTATRQFLFTNDGTFSPKWSSNSTSPISKNTLISGGAIRNGSQDLYVSVTDGYYYTFNIQEQNDGGNKNLSVLETSYNPVSIVSVSQNPATNPNEYQAVQVTVQLSGSLNSGEKVFVRWTTDGFTTDNYSEITSFSGNTGSVSIPAQSSGTQVIYYVLTTEDATPSSSDIDYLTLNFGNNNNANYSYTVGSNNWPTVTSGSWGSFSTWGTTANLPPATANVIAAHNLTLDQNRTISDLTINSGITLNDNSFTLTINGNISNSGTHSGSGKISVAGSSAQSISGGTFGNLEINKTGTATLTSGITVSGNLDVTGGTLSMGSVTSPLDVNGNLTINGGTLTLSSAIGGDLKIGGNYNRSSGTFNANNRAVEFDGSGLKTLTASGGQTFAFLFINKPSGNLQLQNNITITGNTADVLIINNSGGIDLNGNNISFTGTGGDIQLEGGTRYIYGSGNITISGTNNLISKNIRSVSSGALVLGDSVKLSIGNGGIFIDNSSTLTIRNILEMLAGGYVSDQDENSVPGGQSPTYTANATLSYNTGGDYAQTLEWNTNNPPENIIIDDSQVRSTVSLPLSGKMRFANTGSLELQGGGLTLDSTALIINFGSNNYIITSGTHTLTIKSVGAVADTFPVGTKGTGASYNPVIISNIGTADNFSVRVAEGLTDVVTPEEVVKQSWFITEGTTGSSNITLKLQWNSGDEGTAFGPLRSSARLGRLVSITGPDWQLFTTTVAGSNPYTAEASGITEFSLFGVGSENGLPVELSSFTSSVSGRNIKLLWTTETEINSYRFEVERKTKTSGGNWESIGYVDASGNSNSPKNYSYTDKGLNTGKYSYRLKMIDNDGRYEYSKETEAEVLVPAEYKLSQNYPNPFNPITKIEYQLPEDSYVIMEMYNLIGEKVAELINGEKSAGYHSIEIDINRIETEISSGVYLYKINVTGNGIQQSFNDVKKLVILK